VDPGFHQRVSSARSPELGKKGVLVSTGFWMLCDLLTMTTGLYAMVILKPGTDALDYFPLLGDHVLPSGLKAVFLCGLIGTVLSAMVGYSLVTGATFGREIVGRLKDEPDDERIKRWTRVGIAIGCVIAVCLALTVSDVVKDLWYNFAGAIVGALLIPVLLAYRTRESRFLPAQWVSGAMIAAFIVSFCWMLQGKRTNNDSLLVKLAGQEFSLGTLVPGLFVSATVLGFGEVVGRRAIKNDR
jgi:SSS family solute:Na+ symporter